VRLAEPPVVEPRPADARKAGDVVSEVAAEEEEAESEASAG
jgi:hypothetical protein